MSDRSTAEELTAAQAAELLEDHAGAGISSRPNGEVVPSAAPVIDSPRAATAAGFATTDSLGKSLLPLGADTPPPPRPEGSVPIRLPDGRTITMARPKQPVAVKVNLWLGDRSTNPGLVAQYRAVLYVSEINGTPLPPVSSEQDIARRVDMLGDDGVDAAVQAYMIYWPPIVVGELPK